jgi:hypothetical protein
MTTTTAADGKRMSPLSQPLPTTRGAPSSPSPTPATTQAPAATQPVDPSPKAPLSPVAQPFVPAGRTKSQRWQDSSPDGSSSSSPARASFWDVLLARPTAAAMEQKMVSQKSSPRPRPARTSPSIPLRSSWVTEDGWERVESRRSRRRRLAQAPPPPVERFLWTFKDAASIALPPHTSPPPAAAQHAVSVVSSPGTALPGACDGSQRQRSLVVLHRAGWSSARYPRWALL